VHEAHVQVGAHRVDVAAGEVRAVIAVQDLRDPADRPARVLLAPDGLVQRECGLQRRRRFGEHDVPRDRAAVVVLDDRQPRTHSPPVLVDDQDVEHVGRASSPTRFHSVRESTTVWGVLVLHAYPARRWGSDHKSVWDNAKR
jgi:hypothetical protein